MKKIAGFVFLLGLVCPLPVWSTTIRVVNLPEMVESADRIFQGRCTLVEESTHQNGLPVRRYEFQVIQAIKGTVSGETVSFRQLRGPGSDGLGFAGLPEYEKGQEAVLFLAADSRIGLTSPIGFGQGVFSVIKKSPTGEVRLVNQLRNRNLLYQVSDTDLSVMGLQQLRVVRTKDSTLTLEALEEAVRVIDAYQKSHPSGPSR